MSSRAANDIASFDGLRARARACALSVVCGALALSLALPGTPAFADVKKSDIVYGSTVEALGLTVADCPDIDASYAIVMDSDGVVFFERSVDSDSQIASVTKVMTAIVALENGVSTDKITVSAKAAEIGESSANLEEGDVLDLNAALLALMVPSGNDAAQSLCEFYGAKILAARGETGDSEDAEEAFVQAMNDTAAKIGMTNTVFTNPHGLDDGEYADDLHSTARDVAKMIAYAMAKPEFRQLVNQETASITVEREGAAETIELESTDELLGVLEGACGVKTGYTDLAGACFAGAVNRNGSDLYTVVLGASDELQRFTDTETLAEWYYEHMIDYPLVNSSQTVTSSISGAAGQVPLIATVAHRDYVDKTVNATFADTSQTIRVFDLHGNVTQKLEERDLTGDVHAGDVVGQVVFYQHNEEVARVDLIAAEDVAAPNPLEAIGTAVDRFIRGITGQQTVAASTLVNKSLLINDKTSSY